MEYLRIENLNISFSQKNIEFDSEPLIDIYTNIEYSIEKIADKLTIYDESQLNIKIPESKPVYTEDVQLMNFNTETTNGNPIKILESEYA